MKPYVSLNKPKKYPALLMGGVFLMVVVLLTFVKLKVERPMLLADRFWPGTGWIVILFAGMYAAFIAHKLSQPKEIPIWRNRIWTIFTVVFFSQLILGLLFDPRFLMSGKLHLPVPAIVIAGPIYRGDLSVMTILYLSTIFLSGTAWCSHYCYFGALDNIAAQGKTSKKSFKKYHWLKYSLLPALIIGALLFRWFNVSGEMAAAIGGAIGIIGLLLIIIVSRQQKKMFHCTIYCPLGTLTTLIGKINPFRIEIKSSCTHCMVCKTSCKYDALNGEDILVKKAAIGCTLCGDCLSSCHNESIRYKFLNLNEKHAHNLFIFIVVTLHVCSLVLARI